MPNKENIFPEETELSEIVLQKTNQAFEMIRQEDTDHVDKTAFRSRIFFRQKAVAIAVVCILAVSSISAAAAIHQYWGRGMKGNIQASDAQQQELTESGAAKVYRDDPDYSSLAVTDNGVTIAPDTVIVDDRFAYMSFRISGYNVEEGVEPGFETIEVYQGDNPEDKDSRVNMTGTMYDGIKPDKKGAPVYEDGSSIESYEDGNTIRHYKDRDGTMEYVIQASIVKENDSLLGKTMHVKFKNLGSHLKAGFISAVEGNWNFEITLSDVNLTRNIKVGQEVEGTDFVMEDIILSPISMRVNYSVSKAPETKEDDIGIPEVRGVVLKDGTKIPYLTNGGATGYTDSTMSNAYQMAGYTRVIDVDEITALIVLASSGNKKVEILISEKEG